MICSICNHKIEPQPISGWNKGHNPWPIRDKGRCCEDCNSTIVIPTRIAGLDVAIKFEEARKLVEENSIE